MLNKFSIVTESISQESVDPNFYKKIPEALTAHFRSQTNKENFILGRAAAFNLLQKLQLPPEIIKHDSEGIPLFPSPLKASISHKEGIAICAGTIDQRVRSLGVDLERIKPTAPELLKKIGTPKEQAEIDPKDSVSLLTLFSLKEAIYKATYPLLKQRLAFNDAEIALLPSPRLTYFTPSQIPCSSIYLTSRALDGYIFSYCIVTHV